MQFERMFTTIDTHTCGDPTRTVTGGIPVIPGTTIAEKMLYLKENHDWIRQTLMFEPRGNEVQSGVILTTPCTPGTDIGVVYIEVGGYLTMCGHDTIGVATALIESGMIQPREPVTQISLDTPAGVVEVSVQVENGHAKGVSFVNAPAFLFKKDISLELPDGRQIMADLSFGGLYYIIVEAEDVGIEPCRDNIKELIKIGTHIRDQVNAKVGVYHPEMDYITEATHVLFSAPARHPDGTMSNAVVIPPGSVSRSPCGTGTCAKLAQLHARGKLGIDKYFGHESATTGTLFTSRIVEETKVGNFDAVIADVGGRAHVTGMHTFVIDPEDPLGKGFSFL
ncbi:MAG: proline racemase family protein [Desulfobacterales bacterium]|nr:proline racemase family protein [Desulfobacterales bacterium]